MIQKSASRGNDDLGAVPKLKEQIERHPLPDGAGLTAVIDEWEVGDRASVQHDIVVDHATGAVYSADTTKDMLYRLDPATGERRKFKIPDAGLPLGGVFSGVGNVLPPNADAHVAPHSLQVAPDGKLWVTLCLGNKIGVFDPRTESWTSARASTRTRSASTGRAGPGTRSRSAITCR